MPEAGRTRLSYINVSVSVRRDVAWRQGRFLRFARSYKGFSLVRVCLLSAGISDWSWHPSELEAKCIILHCTVIQNILHYSACAGRQQGYLSWAEKGTVTMHILVQLQVIRAVCIF